MKKHISAGAVTLVALLILSSLSLASMEWKTANIAKIPVTLTYVDPISGKKVLRNFSGVFSNFIVMDLDENNHHAFYLHTEGRSGSMVIDESAVGSGVTNGNKTSVLATQGTPMSSNGIVLDTGLTLTPEALIMNTDYTRASNNAVSLNLTMKAAGVLDFFGQPIPGLVSLSVSAKNVPAGAIPNQPIGRDFVFASFSGISPIAQDQNVSFAFGNSSTINLAQGGASFQPDGTLSATVATGPYNGTIPGSNNLSTGKGVYTPVVGFSGVDTLTFFLRDSVNHASDIKTAKLTVGPRPVARDAKLARPVFKNSTTAVFVNLTAFVSNMPNRNIHFGNITGVAHGVLSAKDHIKGKVTYRPQQGFSGLDHFTYSIDDKLGYSQSATIGLNVVPFAVDDIISIRAGIGAPVTLNVLANDVGVDAAGTNLQIIGVFTTNPPLPITGTVAITPDLKQIIYVPRGLVGTDTFTYTMTDTSLPLLNRPVSTGAVIINLTP